ncbi:hypothetical protein C8R43DRAFT_983234 [Mycena crocata]|nr:hypothetical protein C8R43DRAFT_983234 [Mycena crocata]
MRLVRHMKADPHRFSFSPRPLYYAFRRLTRARNATMAPSTLHGLNLVHPPHSPSNSQDLLSGPPFPDLLWTNLVFDSDEPNVDDKYGKRHVRETDEELELEANRQAEESVLHHGHGHVNVVTGTNVPEPSPQQPFDISNFLATFGQPPATISPSIVQLLALHSAVQGNAPSFPQQEQPSTTERSSYDYPSAKRARSRKPSISASVADSPEDPNANPVSVAEDKRRRNTAASARFRLKKKEREAALETRAKELEGRVNELERECEGLRRENGWLKGLVVGVTGAAQAPQAPQQTSGSLKRSRDDLEAA